MTVSFIDSAKIEVHSGKGGAGCASFRRERCIPRGGPDGGDGGRGGAIILKVDSDVNTLAKFRFQKIFKAKAGCNGMGKQRHGPKGEDIVIALPPGTQVFNAETDELMLDLTEAGQTIVIAAGGQGGRGNIHFKSSVNRSPHQFGKGEAGQSYYLRLELSVLADVGLLGLPNAGKSSLIRAISAATPEVANYAFTTKKPYLGVVDVSDYQNFVMADIPGLIEGAASGAGMGSAFLKHLSRTRILLHVVDVASETYLADMQQIDAEIVAYGEGIPEKPRLIVLNKTDLINADELATRVQDVRVQYPYSLILEISALAKVGLSSLKFEVFKQLEKLKSP